MSIQWAPFHSCINEIVVSSDAREVSQMFATDESQKSTLTSKYLVLVYHDVKFWTGYKIDMIPVLVCNKTEMLASNGANAWLLLRYKYFSGRELQIS